MSRFHAGMTLDERRTLRQEIEGDFIARARLEAARIHRSETCLSAQAMDHIGRYTPDQVARKHAECMAEALGGGCLDECHDAALQQAAEPVSP